MALSIKDPEADRLARELAETTGESLTEAVKRALLERLERERRVTTEKDLASRLVQIGQRCAGAMREPFTSSDHAELFFDEQGLPR